MRILRHLVNREKQKPRARDEGVLQGRKHFVKKGNHQSDKLVITIMDYKYLSKKDADKREARVISVRL
ncbi:hypothetical protein DPMN_015219 [Dreissena polymorpha]|uniref:Uncharacterized protein n=1 Tax=Dreissena polymorpha TaxID=45954 RepID=A0A9D4NB35_DREPO|nr:hypothetical protein DPMN_015219 [Dreissena polymorpha]